MVEIKHRHTGDVIHTYDGASLAGASLYGANLTEAKLAGANLAEADLAGARLYGANLYRANLAEANLYGADLRGADLYGADLRGANLRGANLYGADFYGANLYGADFYGANLYGADLRGAKISADHVLVKERPILQIDPIGSRGAVLFAFRTDRGLMLKTGCFFGTPEELDTAVRKTHGDNTHALDYLSALVFVRDWYDRAE